MRRRYLVCYDICDPKRLRKVHKKMKGYGESLQYSVFCCELNARERVELDADLSELIHHEEDRILIVDLGSAGKDEVDVFEFMGDLGAAREVIGPATLVI